MLQLAFFTCSRRLSSAIGNDECTKILNAIRTDEHVLIDLDGELDDVSALRVTIQAALAENPAVRGCVVLGGYNVIRSLRVDTLPADLSIAVSRGGDADRFVVWNDDIYGDSNGDSVPDYPVSRLPDAIGPDRILDQLQRLQSTRMSSRFGIRNEKRPFAEEIFQLAPGAGQMLISPPHTSGTTIGASSDFLYFMLHGDWSRPDGMWGESDSGYPEAVTIGDLPPTMSGSVLSGCCWGALSGENLAFDAADPQSVRSLTPGNSIAIALLAAGATAVLGCTGSHYSPWISPYGYYGAVLHRAIVEHLGNGAAPSLALHAARREFVSGIPHGQRGRLAVAIELKLYHEFTCLGMGW